MSFFSSSKNKSQLVWNNLFATEQLDEINLLSETNPVLIFKHSTRCSISGMAKNRLELYWDTAVGITPFYLDILSLRNLSNEVASRYHVVHQSPQVLLITNGVCSYHASHNEIDFNTLKTLL